MLNIDFRKQKIVVLHKAIYHLINSAVHS